jgi:hypothetical protein
MSASDRDEVTFLCMKRMAEKRVIIVAGTTLHDGNQSCCACYSSERERRSSGFSPMAPLGGRAAEMAGRRRSTVAAGGAPMGRLFRARGGEIGVEVGAVENGGALGAFYRVVGWRNAGGRGEGGSGASVTPVTGDGNGEGEATGCGRFQRGRGEEAGQLQGVGGRRHSEEWRSGRGV